VPQARARRAGGDATHLEGEPWYREPMEADRPRVVGRYALYDELGVGGMGSVRIGVARDGGTLEIVAAKELLPSDDGDPRRLAMLLDETRLTSLVQHPNVVAARDFVYDGSRTILVMDYVHGVSLRKLLVASRAAPVPLPIAASIARDVLRALDAAHQARDERGAVLGLVHRDVSPENILVDAGGAVRLADFGLAKAQGRIASSRSDGIKGKLAYLAPEQVGGEVSARTDIYAAGLVAWEAIAGRRALHGENEAHLLMQVLSPQIPKIREVAPRAPAALDAVLARMLAPASGARFATAGEAAGAWEAALGAAFAPRDAIAAWVSSLVGDVLDARRRRLDAILALERDRHAEAIEPAIASELAPPMRVATWRITAGAALLAVTAWAVTAWAASAGLARTHAKPADPAVDRDAPGATEPPAGAQAAAASTKGAESAKGAEGAGGAPAPPVVDVSSLPAAASEHAPAAPKRRASAPPRHGRAACDPPFTVDAKGIVVYNDDCLR